MCSFCWFPLWTGLPFDNGYEGLESGQSHFGNCYQTVVRADSRVTDGYVSCQVSGKAALLLDHGWEELELGRGLLPGPQLD